MNRKISLLLAWISLDTAPDSSFVHALFSSARLYGLSGLAIPLARQQYPQADHRSSLISLLSHNSSRRSGAFPKSQMRCSPLHVKRLAMLCCSTACMLNRYPIVPYHMTLHGPFSFPLSAQNRMQSQNPMPFLFLVQFKKDGIGFSKHVRKLRSDYGT